MSEKENIIKEFYEAFASLDAERMLEWYDNEVTFEDPAFGILKGERAKNMWRMLCESQQGKEFDVKFSEVEFSETTGKARWEAYYTFGKKGRRVHNIINAHFEFKNGKIIKHVDKFNLYRWSKQAMGIPGFLIGWTVFFRKKLQKTTNFRLTQFESKRNKDK